MKKSLLLSVTILVALFCFAQVDSTGTGSGDTSWLTPKVTIILGVILSIYEIVARLVPTLSNYSIIGFIISIIQKVLPNRSKNDAIKLP